MFIKSDGAGIFLYFKENIFKVLPLSKKCFLSMFFQINFRGKEFPSIKFVKIFYYAWR
jgi:hypothetical protein